MEEYIKFPWLPEWFEWSPSKGEGRTLEREEPYTWCGKQCTRIRKGVDPLPWSTSKSDPRPRIRFRVDGKLLNLYKHKLIWMAHHWQPIPKGYDIHHIDGNWHNNAVENLQLMTAEEHRKLHGKERYKTSEICQKNNTICSKAVIAIDEHNNIVHRFVSVREAKRNGFDSGNVSRAARGCYLREGNHYFKGYYWWYEQEWLAMR